jgi:hypothetical protein
MIDWAGLIGWAELLQLPAQDATQHNICDVCMCSDKIVCSGVGCLMGGWRGAVLMGINQPPASQAMMKAHQ